MKPSEARERLDLVDRIVSASSREFCLGLAGPFFLIWGLFSGLVNLAFALAVHGLVPSESLWVCPALLAAAIVASALYGRYLEREKDRLTFLHREFLNVLWITIGVTFVAMIGGYRLFPGIAAGALWSVASSIVLFFIAFHGNRRALAGGIVLLASLVVANFEPAVGGYVLAAGFFLGYAGFGVVEMVARD